MLSQKYIFEKCSKCGDLTRVIKKEIIGLGLILTVVLLSFFLGLTIGSIIYLLLGIGVGSYWIIKGPYKDVLCDKCKD